MTIKEYQAKAHEFADYPVGYMYTDDGVKLLNWIYPVSGLSEETGEYCGKIAKAFRDENGNITEERKMLAAK